MLKVTPNFHFRGQGKQAIELYKRAFGAEVKVLFCNSDANPEDCEITDESQNDLVYHAEIYIGKQRLTLTDAPDDPLPNTNPLSLLITFETDKDVKKAYEIMSDGATIIYPLQSTDYSSCFVSLVDKFGMRWELMTEYTEHVERPQIKLYSPEHENELFELIEREGQDWTYWQGENRAKYEKAIAECAVYLLFEGETLCGYVRARDDFGFGVYIMDLLVDKAYRGKEYGRLLIEQVCRDFPKSSVYVLGDVYPYYEDKLGYKVEGKVYIVQSSV